MFARLRPFDLLMIWCICIWWLNFWILILNIAYFQSDRHLGCQEQVCSPGQDSLTGDQEPKERMRWPRLFPFPTGTVMRSSLLELECCSSKTLMLSPCLMSSRREVLVRWVYYYDHFQFMIFYPQDPKVPLRDLVRWHVHRDAVVEARGDHRHAVAGGTVLRAWEHACQVQHVGRQLRSSKPPATARSEPSPGRRTPWVKFSRGCSSKEAAPPTYNQWPLQIAMVKADFRAI